MVYAGVWGVIFPSFVRYALTLNGPALLTTGAHKADMQFPVDTNKGSDIFGAIIAKIRSHNSSFRKGVQISSPFPLRCCNIVDPVNDANNLGFNVTKDCLERIDVALKGGHHHLETLVRMIKHAQKPVKVAPALSLPSNVSNGTLSAFVPPSSNDCGFSSYSELFKSGVGAGSGGIPPVGSQRITTSRQRAESAGSVLNGGGPVDAAVAPELPYGTPSVTGGSEYLTVFFAQCRARYMMNAGCRHDLLDHPKQRGSFFVQMGRSNTPGGGSSSRPGSAPGETSRPGSFEKSDVYTLCDSAEESNDPLSGNIDNMWHTYLNAIESIKQSGDVVKPAGKEQKHSFSVLSPSSDLTEAVKYDLEHSENMSSGSKGESEMVEDNHDEVCVRPITPNLTKHCADRTLSPSNSPHLLDSPCNEVLSEGEKPTITLAIKSQNSPTGNLSPSSCAHSTDLVDVNIRNCNGLDDSLVVEGQATSLTVSNSGKLDVAAIDGRDQKNTDLNTGKVGIALCEDSITTNDMLLDRQVVSSADHNQWSMASITCIALLCIILFVVLAPKFGVSAVDYLNKSLFNAIPGDKSSTGFSQSEGEPSREALVALKCKFLLNIL